MLRVKWTVDNVVHIGTLVGVVADDGEILAVVADDEGPILDIKLSRLLNASASPVQRRQVTTSGVTL
jgi:hypothetical protein